MRKTKLSLSIAVSPRKNSLNDCTTFWSVTGQRKETWNWVGRVHHPPMSSWGWFQATLEALRWCWSLCSSHAGREPDRRTKGRKLEFSRWHVATPAGEVVLAWHLISRRGCLLINKKEVVGMWLPFLLQLCLTGLSPKPASSLTIVSKPTNITRESGQVRLIGCQLDGIP